MDREEFFRLKKIQSKKKRDTAAKELEATEKREAAEMSEGQQRSGGSDAPAETGNMLQDKDDDSESAPGRTCLPPATAYRDSRPPSHFLSALNLVSYLIPAGLSCFPIFRFDPLR